MKNRIIEHVSGAMTILADWPEVSSLFAQAIQSLCHESYVWNKFIIYIYECDQGTHSRSSERPVNSLSTDRVPQSEHIIHSLIIYFTFAHRIFGSFPTITPASIWIEWASYWSYQSQKLRNIYPDWSTIIRCRWKWIDHLVSFIFRAEKPLPRPAICSTTGHSASTNWWA